MDNTERPVFPDKNDPNKEPMNNFHFHMPGGFYREPWIVNGLLEEIGEWLDKPEETWPEEQARLIKKAKTGFAIQKDVDAFLEDYPEIFEAWEKISPPIPGKLSRAMREGVLRPIYTKLREKYTEEELST